MAHTPCVGGSEARRDLGPRDRVRRGAPARCPTRSASADPGDTGEPQGWQGGGSGPLQLTRPPCPGPGEGLHRLHLCVLREKSLRSQPLDPRVPASS